MLVSNFDFRDDSYNDGRWAGSDIPIMDYHQDDHQDDKGMNRKMKVVTVVSFCRTYFCSHCIRWVCLCYFYPWTTSVDQITKGQEWKRDRKRDRKEHWNRKTRSRRIVIIVEIIKLGLLECKAHATAIFSLGVMLFLHVHLDSLAKKTS